MSIGKNWNAYGLTESDKRINGFHTPEKMPERSIITVEVCPELNFKPSLPHALVADVPGFGFKRIYIEVGIFNNNPVYKITTDIYENTVEFADTLEDAIAKAKNMIHSIVVDKIGYMTKKTVTEVIHEKVRYRTDREKLSLMKD